MKVVLLHAFPLDARMWEPQLDALELHEVLAPDLYGRGRTVDEWAQSVLREAGDDGVVAVGASMGGYCALAMARIAPERLRGLVLVGARADADSPERREARDATIELVDREGPEALWREMRPALFSENAPADVVERARAIVLEQDPDRLIAGIAAMRDRPDSTEAARSVGAPVLVAVGEHDRFFPPEEAKALAASAREGRFELFRATGHLPSLEQPDTFNAVLARFVSAGSGLG